MAAVQMAGSLLLAAQRGDSAGLQRELLADSSSSLVEDARDETHQMCALCWAAVSDELECVRLLLEDGRASLHSRSAHGMSVLHHAASSASIRTLRLLLEQSVSNAVTNAVNEWDETPVHLAAASGHKTSIECLVAAGADLKLQDRWGRTPAMVARQQGFKPEALGLPPLSSDEERAALEALSQPKQLEQDPTSAAARHAFGAELAAVLARKSAAPTILTDVVERGLFAKPEPNPPPPPAPPAPPPPPPPAPPPPPPPPPPASTQAGASGKASRAASSRPPNLLAAIQARAAEQASVETVVGADSKRALAAGTCCEPNPHHVPNPKHAPTRGVAAGHADDGRAESAGATWTHGVPRKPGLSKLVEYPGDVDEVSRLLAAGEEAALEGTLLSPPPSPSPLRSPSPSPSAPAAASPPSLPSNHRRGRAVWEGCLRTECATQVCIVGQARAALAARASPLVRGPQRARGP